MEKLKIETKIIVDHIFFACSNDFCVIYLFFRYINTTKIQNKSWLIFLKITKYFRKLYIFMCFTWHFRVKSTRVIALKGFAQCAKGVPMHWLTIQSVHKLSSFFIINIIFVNNLQWNVNKLKS